MTDFIIPTGSRSSRIHSELGHPVIDSDGHILEYEPAVFEFLRDLIGPEGVERFRRDAPRTNGAGNYCRNWAGQFMSDEERADERAPRSPWWGLPTRRTFDRAAATLPALLSEFLEQAGIDYSVLYPTLGLMVTGLDDEELRLAGCRAVNQYNAEVTRGLGERLNGVAVIPMHNPGEAIAELRYAVNDLGFKAVVLQSYVARPIPKMAREHPDLAHYSYWLDNFCIDSQYDYDPVWQACTDLGVSPTFHTPGYGWGTRASVSNWTYNHIGAFATAAEQACRSIFFGGVADRFPDLRFGFLEGGVGWAVTLYADIIGHWKKRNKKAVQDYNPANTDMALLRELSERYGGPIVQRNLDRLGVSEMGFKAFATTGTDGGDDELDEFRLTGVHEVEDVKRLFSSFYFGCEADDPVNVLAFDARINPLETRLNAVLSSDIGHFDVPDISEVLEEAYELVEHGLMSDDDFKDFTFRNPTGFWTAANPEFFTGTSVEAATRELQSHS